MRRSRTRRTARRAEARHDAGARSTNVPSQSLRAYTVMPTPAESACRRVRHRGGGDRRRVLSQRNQARLDTRHYRPYVIRAMGANAARRYFLTAEKFDAGELRLGLVHDLAPLRNLTCASTLFWSPDADERKCRERVQTPGARNWRTGRSMTRSSRTLRSNCVHPHQRRRPRGRARFLEKRKPRWVVEYEAMAAQMG